MKCHLPALLFFSLLAILAQVHQAEAFEVDEPRVRQAESAAAVRLGWATAAAVLQGSVMLLTPELHEEIQALADEISEAAGSEIRHQVHIVNNPSMNLFTLPSGDIFVFTGFLDKIDNRDELAFGLGHEIAHVRLNHGLRGMKQAIDLQHSGALVATVLANLVATGAGTAAYIWMPGFDVGIYQPIYDRFVMAPTSGIVARIAAKVPVELVTQVMISAAGSYSQEQEAEADHWGMIYMKRAGYDPAAAITAMEKFSDVRHAE